MLLFAKSSNPTYKGLIYLDFLFLYIMIPKALEI